MARHETELERAERMHARALKRVQELEARSAALPWRAHRGQRRHIVRSLRRAEQELARTTTRLEELRHDTTAA